MPNNNKPPRSYFKQQDEERRYGTLIRQTAPEQDPITGERRTAISVKMWLTGHRRLYPDNRSPLTAYVQYTNMQPFIRKYGKRRMDSITPIEAQKWALKCGQLTYECLKSAWRYAVQMQIVPLNVWLFVVRPKRTKPLPGPPSEEQLQNILLECSVREPWFQYPFANLIEVAAYSGAREGGLIGLRRSHVDLEAKRMIVTEKGSKQRAVVLAGLSWEAMARQFEWRDQQEWRGPLGGADPYVFTYYGVYTPRVKALKRNQIQISWREIRGDYPHGFHGLRHYCATWMEKEGVAPLDIAIQLGHVDSLGRPYERVVRRVYSHPDHSEALQRVEVATQRSKEAANG